MNSKKITLTVLGKELAFDVNIIAYNSYINDLTMTNKVIPAQSFLKKTISKECSDDLKDVLENAGAALQLTAAILEEYAPDLEIEVKK